MIRKTLVRSLAVVMLSVGLLCFGATTAFADTTIKVNPKNGADAYKLIQGQLDKAHKKASAKNKYVIKVKKGSYKLSHSLSIYSNTTLDLTGVKLKATKRDGHMIKVGMSQKDTKKGYFYKNIKILGGDLNNNGNKATTILVAHAKNVVLKNLKVHNSKNAHLMETAGVNGLMIDGCRFYDQKQSKKAKVLTLEAIQLDILTSTHMQHYRAEALPLKNVTIRNCVFQNVPRGVGSHTAFLNSYTSNVKILNNSFINCKSAAIQTRNYANCVIEGNLVKGSPRGIIVETIGNSGLYLSSTAAKAGKTKTKISTKYKTPPKDMNIVVRNNAISVKGSDPFFKVENEAIRVNGFKVSKKTKKTSLCDAIPKGNYYATGVVIEGNNIVTTNHGIRLSDARYSSVSGNTISFKGDPKKAKTGFYGIQLLNGSTSNTITDNRVKDFCTNGIFLSAKSSALSISRNTVTNSGKYAISLLGSKASCIEGNIIDGSRSHGIFLYDGSSVGSVLSNSISNSKSGSGIVLEKNCSTGMVSGNTVSNMAANGIFVHVNSTAGPVTNNSISGIGKYGIFVEDKSSVGEVKGNAIASAVRDVVIR